MCYYFRGAAGAINNRENIPNVDGMDPCGFRLSFLLRVRTAPTTCCDSTENRERDLLESAFKHVGRQSELFHEAQDRTTRYNRRVILWRRPRSALELINHGIRYRRRYAETSCNTAIAQVLLPFMPQTESQM